MAAGDVRAGRAFVELTTKDSELVKGLNRAKAKLKSFGDGLASVGAPLAAIGAAITAPLVASVKLFSSAGDALDKMSQRTGISVESLSELSFALDQSGSSLAEFENGIRRMQANLSDAAGGTGEAVKALDALGVSVADLSAMSPEKQFKTLADRLAGVADPTRRAALAMDIFGKSGTQLLPLLANGAAGIEALQTEARELGITMSTKTALNAAVLNDALGKLVTSMKQISLNIGAALAPAITDLAGTVTQASARVSQFIKKNGDMVIGIAKAAAGLSLTGGAMLALGGVMRGMAAIIGTFGTIIRGTTAALATARAAMAAFSVATAATKFTLFGAAGLIAGVAALTFWLGSSRSAAEAGASALDRYKSSAAALSSILDQAESAKIRFDRAMASGGAGAGEAVTQQITALQEAAVELQRLRNTGQRAISESLGRTIQKSLGLDTLRSTTGVLPDSNQLQNIIFIEEALQKIEKRIKALGGTKLPTPDFADPTATAPITEVDDTAERQARLDADVQRRLHELHIDRIDDEETRALASISFRYSEEIKAAEAAGLQIASLEKARAVEIAAVQADFAQRRLDDELSRMKELDAALADAFTDVLPVGGLDLEAPMRRLQQAGATGIFNARELQSLQRGGTRADQKIVDNTAKLVRSSERIERLLEDGQSAFT